MAMNTFWVVEPLPHPQGSVMFRWHELQGPQNGAAEQAQWQAPWNISPQMTPAINKDICTAIADGKHSS